MSIKSAIINLTKAFSALLLVIASALLPMLSVNADSVPRFNQMEGDAEFLTGRNLTQNEADFHDPVEASAEDTVRVRVYYHNNAAQDGGEPGEAAINTRIKINLPTDASTTHIVSGVLSADNVEAVGGTIVNGEEVGESNLRINSNEYTTIEYIAGSVRWYPNRNEAGAPVALPDGQTGDEIITNQGVLLGDINGCWQYSGYVTLDVRLNSVGEPNIVQKKAAINETQGNVDATTVSAKEGDIIRYELTTSNTGTEATPFMVVDDIVDILEYADVTEISDGGMIVSRPDGVVGIIGYDFINIEPGETVVNTFKVKVKPASEWHGSDFVMTNVYGNVIDIPVNPPTYELKISIDKGVRDLTRNDDGFSYEVHDVKDGDNLEYFIIVENKGEKAINKITIHDGHDLQLDFVDGSTTMTRNGITTAITNVINGYMLDSALKPGEKVELRYRMIAHNIMNVDSCLVNTAYASGEGVGEISDDAQACVVKVEKPVVVTTETPAETPKTPVVATEQPAKLPTTGPVSSSFVLLGLVGSGATTLRYRKAKSALRKAQTDISIL